jgi:thiamine kinase-like enzyme
MYRRSLREVVTNYETILSLYEQSIGEQPSHIVTLVKQAFGLYMDIIDTHSDRPCVSLHGDFWHNNIIFDDKDPYFIDFSRIPYGEP